jgi:hypothetical protein
MSTGIPIAGNEPSPATQRGGSAPVPAPPRTRLAKPKAVAQTPRSARREHEMQQLIRDLAALASNRRPRVS